MWELVYYTWQHLSYVIDSLWPRAGDQTNVYQLPNIKKFRFITIWIYEWKLF